MRTRSNPILLSSWQTFRMLQIDRHHGLPEKHGSTNNNAATEEPLKLLPAQMVVQFVPVSISPIDSDTENDCGNEDEEMDEDPDTEDETST